MFVFYRPDIGYVKESMIYLGSMLVRNLREYEAFSCFINLLHSYHFLSFFRGDIREIEWRVRFFDELLLGINPIIYHHFKALELSSECFLMHWFLSLFTNCFQNESFVARLWDNFLLEGELFAFKIGLAIIVNLFFL